MAFPIEVVIIVSVIFCCLLVVTRSSENEASQDLENLRGTLSEQEQQGRRRQVGAKMEVIRRKVVTSKLFFKVLKEGESVRSLRTITESAKDLYHANDSDSCSRSSLSRSMRAAGTSVQQFRRKPKCTICLSRFMAGEELCWAKTDQCNHVFHFACVGEWLKDHDECPLCRTDIVNSVVVVEGKVEETENDDATDSSHDDIEESITTGGSSSSSSSNNNNTDDGASYPSYPSEKRVGRRR
jgi:hypothetical protein